MGMEDVCMLCLYGEHAILRNRDIPQCLCSGRHQCLQGGLSIPTFSLRLCVAWLCDNRIVLIAHPHGTVYTAQAPVPWYPKLHSLGKCTASHLANGNALPAAFVSCAPVVLSLQENILCSMCKVPRNSILHRQDIHLWIKLAIVSYWSLVTPILSSQDKRFNNIRPNELQEMSGKHQPFPLTPSFLAFSSETAFRSPNDDAGLSLIWYFCPLLDLFFFLPKLLFTAGATSLAWRPASVDGVTFRSLRLYLRFVFGPSDMVEEFVGLIKLHKKAQTQNCTY